MDPRKKRRSSILKTRNSIGSDGGSGSDTVTIGLAGAAAGVSSNPTKGRRVSFSHTAQVKEFANNTNSSNEGSFSKTSDFNQTMTCGDIDMDISFAPGGGCDDEGVDDDRNYPISVGNYTQNIGEMSIMEPSRNVKLMSASSKDEALGISKSTDGTSSGQRQQNTYTRCSVGPVRGFGSSVNAENYPPSMGTGGVLNNTTRSKRVSFSNTAQVKEFTNATTSSVEDTFSRRADLNKSMTMTCGDMDISYILDEDKGSHYKTTPAFLSNTTRINAEMSVMEAPSTPTPIDHVEINHTIFTGSEDMSFSTTADPDPAAVSMWNTQYRKNRMTISTPGDMSVVNPATFSGISASHSETNYTIFKDASLDMSLSATEESASAVSSVALKQRKNRMTICNPKDMSMVDFPQTMDKGLEAKELNQTGTAIHLDGISQKAKTAVSFHSESNHTIFAGPCDMSMSTIEEPASFPSAPQKKGRKNRLTICAPQDMSMVKTNQNPFSVSSNRTRMAGPTEMSIVETAVPTSTGHSSSTNHTVFAESGDMSIDRSYATPSKCKTPRKHRTTMSIAKEMSTVESPSPRRTSERIQKRKSIQSNVTRVNADMSIMDPPVSGHSEPNYTIYAGSVDMSVTTIDVPSTPMSIAGKLPNDNDEMRTKNSALSQSPRQFDALSLLDEMVLANTAANQVPNSTMFTGAMDMSMSTIDEPAPAAHAIDKAQRKNRMTICNPSDMSVMIGPDQQSGKFKFGQENAPPIASRTQINAEMSVLEPVVTAQGQFAAHAEANRDRDSEDAEQHNHVQSHQEQIYPQVTIRKSGAGLPQSQQLYLGKPNPVMVRDPLGKCKIAKKVGDQANPVQFSFGTFGHLKTPKRNRIIADSGPSVASNLRLKATIASEDAQTPPMPVVNAKCSNDIGLDCTIAKPKDKQQLKSVADISMMTSPMIFPTSNILKPGIKTIDVGTSPIVTLGGGNTSTNRSLISTKLSEMTISESPQKPHISPVPPQEVTSVDSVVEDMSMLTVERSRTPTSVAVGDTQRKNRMTICVSKDVDMSMTQPHFSQQNFEGSAEEENPPLSCSPVETRESRKFSPVTEVSAIPSDGPATDLTISSEFVDISKLNINEPSSINVARQSQTQNGNAMMTRQPPIDTSSLVLPGESMDKNKTIYDQSYPIEADQSGSSNQKSTRAIEVGGENITTPIISPDHQNADEETSLEEKFEQEQTRHSQMVSMVAESHVDSENSSSDEDTETEDMYRDNENISNQEREQEEVKQVEEAPVNRNLETEAEAILEAVQNISISISDVPRPYSISLVAETFYEDRDEDEEQEPETIRKAILERTEFQEQSFGKMSNKTMDNQGESSFSMTGVQEPSLPTMDSPAKTLMTAPLSQNLQPPPNLNSEAVATSPRAFSAAYQSMKMKLLNAPDNTDVYKYINFKYSLTDDLCALLIHEWEDIAMSFKEYLGPEYIETVQIQRGTINRYRTCSLLRGSAK